MIKQIIISLFIIAVAVFGFTPFLAAESSEVGKKFSFEVAVGVGRADPREIYDRGAGIDKVISQYAQFYQLTVTTDGEYKENKLAIPFGVAVNYRLNETLYLRAGFDYSGNSATSEKVYQVAWSDFNETHDYEITNKVSYFMPHVGAGYRGRQFDLYGSLGVGVSKFTHSEALNYAEPGYAHRITDTFEMKGNGVGLIIGGKYYLPFANSSSSRFRAFVKLEAVILKINTLTGSKTRSASASTGSSSSETVEGTLYQYSWNPYSTQGFAWWDVYETLPTLPEITGATGMGLNLSGIRVMIGVSF